MQSGNLTLWYEVNFTITVDPKVLGAEAPKQYLGASMTIKFGHLVDEKDRATFEEADRFAARMATEIINLHRDRIDVREGDPAISYSGRNRGETRFLHRKDPDEMLQLLSKTLS